MDAGAQPESRIPMGGGREDLGGVDAPATGDVWTVGVSGGDGGCGFAPGYVEHWNGHAWARVQVPNLKAGVSVTGAAMASTGRVWITGTEGLGRGPWRTLLLSCRVKQLPPGADAEPRCGALLDQITAVSPGDAWAVGGWSRTNYGRTRTLILHWNGTEVVVTSSGWNSPNRLVRGLLVLTVITVSAIVQAATAGATAAGQISAYPEIPFPLSGVGNVWHGKPQVKPSTWLMFADGSWVLEKLGGPTGVRRSLMPPASAAPATAFPIRRRASA